MAQVAGGKPPRIVAELGRPETPEETAARKAENTRMHYANQTVRNLILSLLATLAVVIVLVAVVVRPGQEKHHTVDWHTVASQSQPDVNTPLLDPQLTSKWTANAAGYTTSNDGVGSWQIGFITPSKQYISLVQGIGANPTWVAEQLDREAQTSTQEIGNSAWDVYDYRKAPDPGNLAYAMVLTEATQTIVLSGTGSPSEFRALAQEVAQ